MAAPDKPALSLVMPYYRNPGMLATHYKLMSFWPRALVDSVEVIIVDDGSPEPALDVYRPPGLPRLSIYRVGVDIPWHQHGARNLGAHVSHGDVLLLTDMDHVIPAATLLWVMQGAGGPTSPHPTRAVMFPRRDAPDLKMTVGKDGVTPKPHPNTFAMPRNLWDAVGGYDEDFCEFYGTDSMFRKRLEARAPIVMAPDDMFIVRFPRDVIPDASTTTLDRDKSRRYAERAVVHERKVRAGRAGIPTTLNFPWERVL